MNIFILFAGTTYVALAILMCLQESRRRKISFIAALLLSIFITPFFAYFIIGLLPLRNAKGCKWCDNTANEAEYCGLCGKNDAGEVSIHFQKRS